MLKMTTVIALILADRRPLSQPSALNLILLDYTGLWFLDLLPSRDLTFHPNSAPPSYGHTFSWSLPTATSLP